MDENLNDLLKFKEMSPILFNNLQEFENGYYKLGNKKFIIKRLNGKNVVRVGGGFIELDEFVI